jgi:hypothetical protein
MASRYPTGTAKGGTRMLYFYHGTSLDQARRLMTMDLSPMVVPDYAALDWWEYTDFGKGFYTHPEENKRKAVEWAKRKNREWGVVRFGLTPQEFAGIPGTPLHFRDKRNSRPPNAPELFDSRKSNWIEFVEYNRGIRPSPQRPKDNDWTPRYPWMRGPIWGRVDSGMPGGGPPIPDHVQQINWGRAGLVALNADTAKSRRFLFHKDNEHLLEFEAGPCWINDDDQVRDWVNSHSLPDIGRLSTADKLTAIRALMDGWISDDDVAAIARICSSVTSRTEADAIRGGVDLLAMTSIGQRTAVRVAFARMP